MDVDGDYELNLLIALANIKSNLIKRLKKLDNLNVCLHLRHAKCTKHGKERINDEIEKRSLDKNVLLGQGF